MASLMRAISRPGGAEDIRDLQGWTGQDRRSSRKRGSSSRRLAQQCGEMIDHEGAPVSGATQPIQARRKHRRRRYGVERYPLRAILPRERFRSLTHLSPSGNIRLEFPLLRLAGFL